MNSSPELLQYLLNEGVTEVDIKWWGSLNAQQQEDIKNANRALMFTAFNNFINLKITPDEAMKKVMTNYILYGDFPVDSGYISEHSSLGFSKEDYYLPWELSDRVGRYVSDQFINNKEKFSEQVKSFSTVNAFLRNKIKNQEF